MTNAQLKRRARRVRLSRLGLNWRGKPFKRRQWNVLTLAGLHGKEREAERRRRIRKENVAAGLTVRGTIRQRRRWPELAGKSRRERNTAWHRDWVQRRRYDRGLTARGKPRFSRKELAWRELRSSMNIVMPRILFDDERRAAA